MNKFFARNGQFWLNDQPLFIQAGEFHYYRTPKDQWRHRLELLKGAGFNTLATYIPWIWHQLQEDVTDLDGHSHPMRDLAGFLDLATEMGFYLIPRPGPYIMAETINEGIPPWVFKNYPQVAFTSQDGIAQNVVSYLHPDFLACVKKWYREIFAVLAPRQITRGGRILMVQLDNEMGMIAWVRNIMDINPDTLSRFAAYLRKMYGADLAARYPSESLEEFLKEKIAHPEASCAAAIVEDYRRFYREYLREYTEWLWAEAKAQGLEVPPVINIHGFANGGKTFPIGISQLISVMEMDGLLSATDVYPGFIGEGTYHQLLMVNEMTKALDNPNQPLFSMEFQAGGNQDFSNGQSSLNDLHTRLCISTGMRAINHYLFCDGENDPVLSPTRRHDWGHPVRKDGSLRRHYHRYPRLSRVLQAYGNDLVLAQPRTVTTIGFLLDYFMTEVNNQFTQEATNIITHQRETVLFDMIGRGLALTHRPFDAVEISKSEMDVTRMPVCWVMMEKLCNAATQRKLVRYLEDGGKLILAGRICNEEFDHTPCTILRDALGISERSCDTPFELRNIHAFDYCNIPVTFVETYTGVFDEVFARDEEGAVIGFVKKIGKGKVMMFGAALGAYTLDDLDVVNQMAFKMEIPPLFQLSDWLDTRLSRGENGSFLFVSNYQDDPIETSVACDGRELFAGKRISLPARSGLILPLDWRVRPGVLIDYSTAEIVEVSEEGKNLLIKTLQTEFTAELTLTGYTCNGSETIRRHADTRRVRVSGHDGLIVLRKED